MDSSLNSSNSLNDSSSSSDDEVMDPRFCSIMNSVFDYLYIY